jgi:hypothetical protein
MSTRKSTLPEEMKLRGKLHSIGCARIKRGARINPAKASKLDGRKVTLFSSAARVLACAPRKSCELIQIHVVDVAPAPFFSAFGGLNDGMLRLGKVGAGMTVLGRVAAPNIPALQAHA